MPASPGCAARQHNEMYAPCRSARNYILLYGVIDGRQDFNYWCAIPKVRDVVGRGFSRDVRRKIKWESRICVAITVLRQGTASARRLRPGQQSGPYRNCCKVNAALAAEGRKFQAPCRLFSPEASTLAAS
jgi:hypothetical protein